MQGGVSSVANNIVREPAQWNLVCFCFFFFSFFNMYFAVRGFIPHPIEFSYKEKLISLYVLIELYLMI